ncbi:DUF397 domain-containing protein [Actinomadura sp. KC345]|uniref:DUF397 domain-containing protein n=1 Tax=Actinomadura sp. KC345 TaxID=2530371 RepID=UPI00104BC9D5|nr:DUF397 domain-containing protein [Actinomadura sp. KC345]TDC44860.1 DUF397 domain-containing protein [Actinomadura sp. KC345]
MTTWRKSSYSGSHGTSDCVEVASIKGGVGIRDSKSPSTHLLTFSKGDLAALVGKIKSGELEL